MGTVTKMTSKHQTTIPAEVRQALNLGAGDLVEFLIEGETVSIRKAEARISDDLAFRLIQGQVLRDWDTPEDDEAFRDL